MDVKEFNKRSEVIRDEVKRIIRVYPDYKEEADMLWKNFVQAVEVGGSYQYNEDKLIREIEQLETEINS
jgi:heptaprenylglyceryl phosphate synthase